MLPDWSGTAVCIASGPSLTDGDVERVRASGHPVVVTNTTFRRCPWAAVLFGHDAPWWRAYIAEVRSMFHGLLFSTSPAVRNLGVEWARSDPRFAPFGLSGTDAISLAIGAGAQRVVLLAYDADYGDDGRTHHHGDHPPELHNLRNMHQWPGKFGRLARYAQSKGVEVLNASRMTSLQCFERRELGACL